MKLLGIELTPAEFDFLMCEQAKGKELKVVDEKVVAEERMITDEEKNQMRIAEYENKIVAEIRKKYNINQELAILRQRDTKPEEFAEYNEYVEYCKKVIKESDPWLIK